MSRVMAALAASVAAVGLGGCQMFGATLNSLNNQASDLGDRAAAAYKGCFSSPFADATSATDPLAAQFKRAQDCTDFYRSISAGGVALDLGGTALTGVGTLGALASGAGGTSTLSGFGIAALAPVVLRDITSQPEQLALARQAKEATLLARCHARLVDDRFSALISNATPIEPAPPPLTALRDQVDTMISTRYGQLLAARNAGEGAPNPNVPQPGVADLVTQDPRLAELVRLSSQITDMIDLAKQDARSLPTADDQVAMRRQIAQRLQLRLDLINEMWTERAVALAPTPDDSLRTLLASPFTASARLISGGAAATAAPDTPAVERARFDFSGARMSYGVPVPPAAATAPVAINVMLFDQSDWPALRAIQTALRDTSRQQEEARARRSEVAAMDARIARGSCLMDGPAGE